MKITDIKISILETPGARRLFELTMIPGMRRPRWTHGHLLSCIFNTSYYEYFGGANEQVGKGIGMLNPLTAVGARMYPPDGSGWGAEWDWDYFNRKVVEVW